MKKAYVTAPHELRLVDEEIPVPGPDEVLIRMHRASLCVSDVGRYEGDGFEGRPRGIGHDASGIVQAIGGAVTMVRVGDPVSLTAWMPCWQCRYCQEGTYTRCLDRSTLPARAQGWFSEYVAAPQRNVIPLVPGCSLDDGALLESAYTGIYGHRVLGYGAGEVIPVFGAGWMAWGQITAIRNAGSRAIAIASNPRRLELAYRFGAVADFRQDDPDLGQKIRALNDGQAPWYLIDSTGGHDGGALPLCQEIGAYGAIIGLLARKTGVPLITFMRRNQQIRAIASGPWKPLAVQQVAEGKIDLKPCISHRVAFQDLQEAFRLMIEERDVVTKVMVDFT